MDGNKCFRLFAHLFCVLTILLISSAVLQAQQSEVPPESEEGVFSGLNLDDFESGTSGVQIWENNPFVKPTTDVSISDLELTGIIFGGPGKAAAIISDHVLFEGDKIGTSTLVGIERERVILRNEEGLFSLSLKGGQ